MEVLLTLIIVCTLVATIWIGFYENKLGKKNSSNRKGLIAPSIYLVVRILLVLFTSNRYEQIIGSIFGTFIIAGIYWWIFVSARKRVTKKLVTKKVKRIELLLDYRAFPIWVYDENDNLIENSLPYELKKDTELNCRLINIQRKYESLFLDTKKEFSYRGFNNIEDKINFKKEINRTFLEIANKLNNKEYEFIKRIDL